MISLEIRVSMRCTYFQLNSSEKEKMRSFFISGFVKASGHMQACGILNVNKPFLDEELVSTYYRTV
jgi:hypothetical protein